MVVLIMWTCSSSEDAGTGLRLVMMVFGLAPVAPVEPVEVGLSSDADRFSTLS